MPKLIFSVKRNNQSWSQYNTLTITEGNKCKVFLPSQNQNTFYKLQPNVKTHVQYNENPFLRTMSQKGFFLKFLL